LRCLNIFIELPTSFEKGEKPSGSPVSLFVIPLVGLENVLEQIENVGSQKDQDVDDISIEEIEAERKEGSEGQ
jgi:hypothetical protein